VTGLLVARRKGQGGGRRRGLRVTKSVVEGIGTPKLFGVNGEGNKLVTC